MSTNRYYSPSTRGFYTTERHGDQVPKDATRLATGEYEKWADYGGEIAGITAGGLLVMAPPPVPIPIE
ncbi:Uncharacterised protein [Achromobacter sp. 2789STDY5608615]|uniref:hypothetical protein n=1 Tax=Achromobacter TaxID=222 RepID=UPI0006C3997B|nr:MULTISPECIES: hypothetical protein [Achromobacter]CUK22155.1 Uncharacterised protein [Achromobacter sp. 2789STDY5608615]